MTREDIISYLEPFWSRTLSFMKEALRSDVPLLDSVNESVAGASGKMLRPMMSLLVARAIGTPNDDSCRYASACELLHNATLMHDDVADESSRRRGRPTVSALLGPSAAVLVGDFWLSKAVELAANSQHFVKVVKIFSKSLTDLAEGEMFQMEKAGSCDTDEEDYYRIIKCKTASLFEAAGVSGADVPDLAFRAHDGITMLLAYAAKIRPEQIGDDTTPLEDAKPTIVTTLPTNTSNSLAQAGNNYSNLIANSIAINGNFDEFSFYFDSHAGDAWNTNYGLRHVVWTMKDGTMTNYEAVDANAEYDETMFGEDAMMTLSPLGLNRIIFDGSQISTKEFEISLAEGVSIEHPGLNDDEVAVEAAGSNYFRYADDIFMATPTFNADDNSYGVNLYNITDGLDKAEKLAQVDNLLSTEGRQPMNAFGVVRNADIDLYLMAGNQIAKVTTEGIEQATEMARIFAYNLKTEKDGEDAYTLSFNTIIPATEASVNLINTHTGEVELTIPATGADCEYTATVQKSDVAENTNYTWEAAVKAGNVTSFKEFDVQQLFTSPYGIAVNNNPANVYFGNVYVSNTTEGETPRGNVDVGIYEYAPNGDNISSSDVSAGIEWTGVAGQGPRRIAVAADGRIFASDYSTENAGIYVIDPDTWTGTPLFKDAVNDGNGSLTVNGTYVGGRMVAVGVRGEGESTQLYAADATVSGASWKKFVNRYDIGTASEWSTAPSYSAAASSYIGNENSSIVPVSTGFWAARAPGTEQFDREGRAPGHEK